jgi:hypothetical protein
MRASLTRMALAAALGAGAYAGARLAVAFSRRYDFRDRLVVITGGSRGLGLLLARQLADHPDGRGLRASPVRLPGTASTKQLLNTRIM